MVAKKVVGAKRKVADSAEDATDYPNQSIPPMIPVNMCVEDGERSRPKRAKRKAINDDYEWNEEVKRDDDSQTSNDAQQLLKNATILLGQGAWVDNLSDSDEKIVIIEDAPKDKSPYVPAHTTEYRFGNVKKVKSVSTFSIVDENDENRFLDGKELLQVLKTIITGTDIISDNINDCNLYYPGNESYQKLNNSTIKAKVKPGSKIGVLITADNVSRALLGSMVKYPQSIIVVHKKFLANVAKELGGSANSNDNTIFSAFDQFVQVLTNDLKNYGSPKHFPNRESVYKNCFDDYDFGKGDNATIQQRVIAFVQSMNIKLTDSFKSTSNQNPAPFEALNAGIVHRRLLHIIKSGREKSFQLPFGVKYKSIVKKSPSTSSDLLRSYEDEASSKTKKSGTIFCTTDLVSSDNDC